MFDVVVFVVDFESLVVIVVDEVCVVVVCVVLVGGCVD